MEGCGPELRGSFLYTSDCVIGLLWPFMGFCRFQPQFRNFVMWRVWTWSRLGLQAFRKSFAPVRFFVFFTSLACTIEPSSAHLGLPTRSDGFKSERPRKLSKNSTLLTDSPFGNWTTFLAGAQCQPFSFCALGARRLEADFEHTSKWM